MRRKENKIKKYLKKWGDFESRKIEFKESRDNLSRDIWETISAFANTRGGLIMLGFK